MSRNKAERPNQTISVVMATYTGEDNITRALESIASQKVTNLKVEVTIVIDGPNHSLFELVESQKSMFDKAGITFRVKMLQKNKGRFQAMLSGAKMSSGKWIVLTGDRILWPAGFLSTMAKQKKDLVIPDTVEEGWEKSSINLTLHHLRELLYKRKGGQLKPTIITRDNFEKSAKGSGGMWIDRRLFLWACDQIKNPNQKHVSDDTKILGALVNNGHNIYWTNETHIIYSPRPGLRSQISHIYNRGPRFVNYYIRPGTRYFLPLILVIIFTSIAAITLFLKPLVILSISLLGMVCLIILSLILAQKFGDIPRILFAIPIMSVAFYLGLLKGLVIHFTHGKRLKAS